MKSEEGKSSVSGRPTGGPPDGKQGLSQYKVPALIVLEGADGSGKSTQGALLTGYFQARGQRAAYLHFPQLDRPPYGELIADLLRGGPGPDHIPPRLAALLFALNRAACLDVLADESRRFVVVDRYVYSNLAYQAAREPNPAKREALRRWISDYEFTHLKLPRPDLAIFLDVQDAFREDNLRRKSRKLGRTRPDGSSDVYERDLALQRRVVEEFRQLTLAESGFERLECYDGPETLPPDEINRKIIGLIKKKLPGPGW